MDDLQATIAANQNHDAAQRWAHKFRWAALAAVTAIAGLLAYTCAIKLSID